MAMTSFWQIEPPEEVQYASSGRPISFSNWVKIACVCFVSTGARFFDGGRRAVPFSGESLARSRGMRSIIMSLLRRAVKLRLSQDGDVPNFPNLSPK
jgi:hypothetical protein